MITTGKTFESADDSDSMEEETMVSEAGIGIIGWSAAPCS